MSETFWFRAGLEWNTEFFDREIGSKPLSRLPVDIGPFTFALSPNALYYLATTMGQSDKYDGEIDGPPPDQYYPNSIIYVETKVQVSEDEYEEAKADEVFEKLEGLIRLFQAGHVCLRRNESLATRWRGGEITWFWYLNPRPVKPMLKPLYERQPYRLEDDTLKEFSDFFNRCWSVVDQKTQPIYNALIHFNASYEQREPSTRLIELMIAMEALFGDNEYHRYKIPLRFSCLLYPPGEARKRAFKLVRELYDKRSALVHGVKLSLEGSDLETSDKFEEEVRRAINRFIELHNAGVPNSTGAELDDLLFFSEKLWPRM